MGHKPHIYVCSLVGRPNSRDSFLSKTFNIATLMCPNDAVNDADMPCLHMSHKCVRIFIHCISCYTFCVSHMLTDMAYIARIYTRIPCTHPREIRASPAASLDCHVGVARGYFINISSAQNAWRCCLTSPSRTLNNRLWC